MPTLGSRAKRLTPCHAVSVDCCDGTDESSGACPNTCAEAGSANRAALKARWASFKFGLKSRENYVVDVVADKRKWEHEIGVLGRRESELVKTVAKLHGQFFPPAARTTDLKYCDHPAIVSCTRQAATHHSLHATGV